MTEAWAVALIRSLGEAIRGALLGILAFWLMRLAVRAELNRK